RLTASRSIFKAWRTTKSPSATATAWINRGSGAYRSKNSAVGWIHTWITEPRCLSRRVRRSTMAVEVTKGATTGTPREGSTEQWVYMAEDAPATNRDLLGGKGAGLAAMTQAGLPVPPAFTITTAACNAYQGAGGQFPAGLWEQTLAALEQIEQKSGRKLGDAANPLLVSVRSGARESMPGMMDTVLNLGLNDETVAGLARQTTNERFAWDAYRRFVQMFGRIVLDVDGLDKAFEH